mgnify:CR=1 FL=1
MTRRRKDMEAVFERLSEENKDIMILIAKGMKAAKEDAEKLHTRPQPTA